MTRQNLQPRFWILVLIVLAAATIRILNGAEVMPWANFPIIGAVAVFTGSYFKRWTAVLISLLTLLISDITINLGVYNGKFGVMHGGWWWIYTIFFLIVIMDWLIMRKATVTRFIIASVVSSLMHWLLSDFMLWINGSTDLRTLKPLSRDIDGLVQCYVQGIPFLRNYLVGTLVYGAIMFGIFVWIKRRNATVRGIARHSLGEGGA
jgi:hypothetical protein